MGVPTHGLSCKSYTYPIICRYCGEKVFLFGCNHGSVVIFEELGWPWIKHDCQNPENIIQAVNFNIAEDYIRLIQENAKQRRQREDELPIRRYLPQPEEVVNEIGIVREINTVDVYRRYRFESGNAWQAAMLGPIAKGQYMQVTIHVGDLSRHLHSYTFYIQRGLWNRFGAIKGDLMEFRIEGYNVPGHESYWLCTNIQQLY